MHSFFTTVPKLLLTKEATTVLRLTFPALNPKQQSAPLSFSLNDETVFTGHVIKNMSVVTVEKNMNM